jgi:hypothetical protein
VLLKIPNGTKGAYLEFIKEWILENITNKNNESEFLVGKGKKLRIDKILYSRGKNLILLCEMLE